jgi:hypothetical protein
MPAFCDTYDYWNLNEEWFVSGSSLKGAIAVQFNPTRKGIIKAVDRLYRDSDKIDTLQLMDAEHSWHEGELV